MMPHFDAAAKSPQNTVSPVKINETMINSVNQYIQKNVNQRAPPIQVDGYPSILLINQKAEKVADVETKRDTSYLSNVMKQSGNLAEQAGLNQSLSGNAIPSAKLSLNENSVQRKADAEDVVEDVVENELILPSSDIGEAASNSMNLYRQNKNGKNGNRANRANNVPTLASISANAKAPSPQPAITINSLRNQSASKANNLTPTKEMEKRADAMFSLESPVAPIQPPSMNSDVDDDLIISNTPEQKICGGAYRHGGSLLQAMTRTTYTLAPAAALLATAALVMKRRGSSKKRVQKHRTNQTTQKTQKTQKTSLSRRK
jgi:hypothetical protein